MTYSEWWFIHNDTTNSWEIISNQAFATKEFAEEYLKQNQKTPEDVEKIKKYDELTDLFCDTKDREIKLEKEIQHLKEELDSMIKHKIMFEHSFSEENYRANKLQSERDQLKSKIEKTDKIFVDMNKLFKKCVEEYESQDEETKRHGFYTATVLQVFLEKYNEM